MNLLFSINRRFVSLLLDCLHSIARRGGAEAYDAYILHSDLTEAEFDQLRSQSPDAVSCHFLSVPETLFDGFPVTDRYPREIYYRLAAPLLLPEALDRILYLDVDTVIINSLLPLYETDFEGSWFMACSHTNEFLAKLNMARLGMGLKENVPYVNTGVMMMNLPPLRQHLDLSEIQSYALAHQKSLILPDQDILTALYGQHVKLLDRMIYNLSDRRLSLYNADPRNTPVDLDWVRTHSVIIHYLGKNKPWKPGYSGVLDVFYHENQADISRC